MANRLKASGAKNVMLMRFKDGGHGVFRAKETKTYIAMEEFFAKVLKRGPGTTAPKNKVKNGCK